MSELTIILANGDFPKAGGYARRLLERAARIVCCDGAAQTLFRETGRIGEVTIGDFDSLTGVDVSSSRFVHVAEQETNDLVKAIKWCREHGWRDLAVLGAGGGREDHLISNVFRALEFGVPIITDNGRFEPVGGEAGACRRFPVRPNCPVSVFAIDPATHITSVGLVWPLDEVKFINPYCATLNRAAGNEIVITSDRPAYIYFTDFPNE